MEGNLAPSTGKIIRGYKQLPNDQGDYETMILSAWRGIEEFDWDCRLS